MRARSLSLKEVLLPPLESVPNDFKVAAVLYDFHCFVPFVRFFWKRMEKCLASNPQPPLPLLLLLLPLST